MNNSEKANANENSDASVTKGPVAAPALPGLPPAGTVVNINKTTLSGAISGYHISKDGKTLHYLVEYEEDGENHEKAFLPDQITIKPKEA